jgi:CHAD domain-containing protein
MIKSWDGSGPVSVAFTLPAAVGAAHAAICGEWNHWAPGVDVMARSADGFVLTVQLEGGRRYRFRYLLDGQRWENDWAADDYVPNGLGSEDSVVDLTALPHPPLERRPEPVPEPEPEARKPEARKPEARKDPLTAPPVTSAGTSVEREAKLMAPAGLGMPDLNELVPGTRAVTQPVERLDATYYDTADLRLARSGITLRHRDGETGPPWTVKLPEDGPGSDLVRREIRFEGSSDHVPNPAADLVLATTRAVALESVARLTTVRRPVEIRDGQGQLLAEVVDDTVSVSHDHHPVGRFREVEVELHASGGKGQRVLDAALTRLIDAGCDAEPPRPKLVRALGERALRPPDVVVPALGENADARDLVHHATALSVAQVIRHDPGARLGDDDEDVHKLRVAARRLRSDLHSFSPLLEKTRVDPIRTELSWLGGVVGAVRDTDVLTVRLTSRLAALAGGDGRGADRLMELLRQEAGEGRAAMLTALRDARYLHLLDTLVELAAAPPFIDDRPPSVRTSRKIAAKIMEKPWRRLTAAVAALGSDPSDTQLHGVRILAKRSRYAAEATAPLLGPAAVRFAASVADLQTVLGDHQDTVLAEEWLLGVLATAPEVCETVHQLVAVERSRRAELRAQWPAVWQRVPTRKLP